VVCRSTLRVRLAGSIGLSVLGVLVAVPAAALDPLRSITQYTQTTWGVDDGLPQSSVTSIAQSAEGYLWMGTQGGLARFDGSNFVVIDRRVAPALPHDFVSALARRSEGGLWVGTYGGLAVLEGDTVRRWPLTTRSERVTTLMTQADGTLWVGTEGGGIERVRGDESELFDVAQGLPHSDVRVIVQTLDGAVWAGTREGLARWTGERFVVAPETRGRAVLALAEDPSGRLWVGTGDGVLRREGATLVGDDELQGAAVSAILADGDDNVWFAVTGRGLVRRHDGLYSLYAPPDGLPADDLLVLFEDRERTVWLGANGVGLVRLKDSPLVPFGHREGLARDPVFAVLEARDGSLWVGTHGGGLDHMVGGRIEHLTTADGLAHDFIAALHEDRRGDLWIGTRGGGLDRLSPGGTITHFGSAEGLGGQVIFALAEDARGRLWVASERGLYRRARDAARFEPVPVAGTTVITALRPDREGSMWVGTQQSGLLLVLDDAHVVRYGRRDGLPDDFVTTIRHTSGGDLWIGTTAGLAHLAGGTLRPLGAAQGLFDGVVLDVLDDDRGHVWLSSNDGLRRVTTDDLHAVVRGDRARVDPLLFDSSDGMRTRECNGGFHPAAARSAAGRLWFPTMRGLVEIDARGVEKRSTPPSVLIDGVVADGHTLSGPALVLPPGTHKIEVRYATIGLDGPNRRRFRYQLEGFDAAWVDAASRQVAYYTNLPPGEYHFRVQARRGEGAWSSVDATTALEVEAFVHERPGFYLALGLGLGLLVYGSYRLRVRRIRARSAELEQAIQARTVELEARGRELMDEVGVRQQAERALTEAKERAESAAAVAEQARVAAEQSARAKGEFLANMSHEIRTPLNAVLGMTDLVMAGELEPGQREMLGVARGAADSLLTILNDILDLSKIESGMLVLSPVPFVLCERLEAVVSVVRYQAQVKGVALEVVVDDEVDQVLVGDPERLRQILLNLLANAVKFTARGSVRVRVRVLERCGEARVLSFAVRDTGVGIPLARQQAIFEPFEQADGSSTRRFGGTGLGLAIAKKLVMRMGGHLEVVSEPGQGSTFTFTVRLQAGVPEAIRRVSLRAPAPIRPLDVLLAEDNLINQKVAVRLLEKQGHRVVVVPNGRDAVESVRVRRFDVVLMDLHMPEMDGIEATRAIRELEAPHGAHTPIIALTAGAMAEDRQQCLEAGMDAYLTKPVRLDGLTEALAAAVPVPRGGAA
jgi:signal transduction histidine kinase/ligand-binding sensor domain-containing protein/CheY-like chemotaxis protein